jgi:hypothetical protein
VINAVQEYGAKLFEEGATALKELDISAITDFDTADLLKGAEEIIDAAKEYASEAVEFISSFW